MKWFILFLSLPIVEIFVFFKVNEIIGIMLTLIIIISTALIGAIFVKSQAIKVLTTLHQGNINPLLLISHGALILAAGIFLLTPGFITDIFGFFLLIPNSRDFVIKFLSKRFIYYK